MATLRAVVFAVSNALSRTAAALWAYSQREPVRTIGIVRSALMLLAAFWPGLFSEGQSQAIIGLAVALLPLDQAIREQVSPA